ILKRWVILRRSGDRNFLKLALIMAFLTLVIFVLLLVSLVVFSWPSIQKFGISFLWSNNWNPVTEEFGALAVIVGTLVTSVLALIIAIPFSLGIALLIDELLPRKIGQVLARIIELMAGIPSIVYGIWGLFVLLPWVKEIQMWLMPLSNSWQAKFDLLAQQGSIWAYFEPIVMFFIRSLPTGSSVFAASIILAVMVIPLISSVMRDVIGSVPEVTKEAAFGTGATRWEVTKKIIFPFAAPGMIGAVILGFGRALGETMAVTFVIGNVHALKGLFMPSATISSSIANEFNEALGTLYPAALVETGLILFIITLVVLICSRAILKRYRSSAK
ncbi:phosphate ABC transporter permease subunit PstC, partial [Fangia hongkongensis]